MKPIYVFFGFRHNKKDNRMIVAVAMYNSPDADITNLGCLKVSELNPWDSSDYVKIIQSYANALNYIYSMQAQLDKYGYDTVVLMTPNKILHGWLAKGESHGFKEWFAGVHRPFRTGSNKEITLRVSLGELATCDPVYKYCNPELVGKRLRITYRGVQAIPEHEVKEAEAKADAENQPRMLSIAEILRRDELVGDVSVDGLE